MDPNLQRIAIAKACGWTQCRMALRGAGAPERGESPYGVPPGRNYTTSLPSYLTDLNAIHEAIMIIIVRGKNIVEFRSNEHLFQEELDYLCEREQVPVWHFTAALYSEALLRTIGKWV